jgi:hypothetical protein
MKGYIKLYAIPDIAFAAWSSCTPRERQYMMKAIAWS